MNKRKFQERQSIPHGAVLEEEITPRRGSDLLGGGQILQNEAFLSESVRVPPGNRWDPQIRGLGEI